MLTLTVPEPMYCAVEFYFYYFAFAMVVPYMFKVTYDLSTGKFSKRSTLLCKLHFESFDLNANIVAFLEDSPHYPEYEYRLSPGWIFGRKVVCIYLY